MKLKKITAFMAAAVIAAGICTGVPTGTGNSSPFAITAEAASDFKIETDSDGYKYVSAYKGKGGAVTIPSGVDYIGSYAFSEDANITSVTIPASCTSVFAGAFAYCPNLKTVVFEGDVTIGNKAFYMCPSLVTVTIKGSIDGGIYASAFANCNFLKTVKISKNTKSFVIGGDAFYNCYSLTSINIPSKCSEIYPGAFLNCFSLTKLTIPANTKINEDGDYNSYHFGMYEFLGKKGNYEYGVANGKKSGEVTVYGTYSYIMDKYKMGEFVTEDIMLMQDNFTPKAITLTVTKGSAAEKWAKKNNVKYTYASDSSTSSSEKLAAPTGIKTSKTQTKITLSWGAVNGADGYRVYMYNEKTGKYEKYKDVASAKCSVTDLKKGTKYKFKVAALVKKDGKYTVQTASKAVSATTKE